MYEVRREDRWGDRNMGRFSTKMDAIKLILFILLIGASCASKQHDCIKELGPRHYDAIFRAVYDECHELQNKAACDALWKMSDTWGEI